MEKAALLEKIELYLTGQMTSSERAAFEQLRLASPEVDMAVVEHRFFLAKMKEFKKSKNLREALQVTYNTLVQDGEIVATKKQLSLKERFFVFYAKNKKYTAVAASIVCFTILLSSGLFSALFPRKSDVQQLSREVAQIKKTQHAQFNTIKEVVSKLPEGATVNGGGSAFLIDGKGFLITNAHVLKGSGAIVVNKEGREFNTTIVYVNHEKDLAILKIKDEDFRAVRLPYAIKNRNVEIGEDLFTLGYPRNEITYNLGYASAATGYDGDTSAFQLSMLVNPGNSGSPVFNKDGEVVGVLSAKQSSAEGVSFAISSKEIVNIVKSWKEQAAHNDTVAVGLKLAVNKKMYDCERVDMLKELSAYIFMVKAYR